MIHKRWVFIIILLFIAAHCVGQIMPQPFVPDFRLRDHTGNVWSSKEQFPGKFTLVLFWATWGNDSIEMLDNVSRLMERYHERGLEAVGICVERRQISDSLRMQINSIIDEKKLTYPVLMDDDLQTFRAFGIIAVPTTLIVDSTCHVIFSLAGYPVLGRERLSEYVRTYFDGPMTTTIRHKFVRPPDTHALRFFNMASLKYARGESDSAKKYASEAVAADSGFVEPLILLSKIAIDDSNFQSAQDYITKALRLTPMLIEAQCLAGFIAAHRDDTTRAHEILTTVLQQSDTIAIAHAYLGYLYIHTGNLTGAESELTRARELNPFDYRIPLIHAELYVRIGNFTKAKEYKMTAKQLRRKQ